MNPLEIILMDDEPNSRGPSCHLTPEQRLSLFESWWEKLSHDAKKELANADIR